MKLLAFDTSSQALSVALTEDDNLLGKIDLNIKQDKTILSLEVWYKDKGQQKIKFKNLIL